MRVPASTDNYERQCEVQRFYRGSSKEPQSSYQESYGYDRGHNERLLYYILDIYHWDVGQ